jgi:hypothetical protein
MDTWTIVQLAIVGAIAVAAVFAFGVWVGDRRGYRAGLATGRYYAELPTPAPGFLATDNGRDGFGRTEYPWLPGTTIRG